MTVKRKSRAKKVTKQYNSEPSSVGSVRAEIIIGVIGFILSIIFHELFHLFIHWHQITGIQFFPNFYTIAELVVKIPATYDLASEEFIAYSISATVLIATAIIIGQVHDASDTRSVNQILFPRSYLKKAPTKPKKKVAVTKRKTA